jgi:hypothetical protein
VGARLPDALRTPSREFCATGRKSMPEKLTVTGGNSPERVEQAGKTPGRNPKSVRQRRVADSPKQGNAHPETRPGQIVRAAENGNSRVNGHSTAALSRNPAASEGECGPSVAIAATSDAPGTVRDADAEPAAPSASGDHSGTDGDANSAEESSGAKDKPIPGGEFPLPSSPDEFVDEIHRRIDLFEVWQKLLRNEDPKIQQRAVEKLTEMRYKGAAALAEEPQQIVIDIDSAVARRAAEGARQ